MYMNKKICDMCKFIIKTKNPKCLICRNVKDLNLCLKCFKKFICPNCK